MRTIKSASAIVCLMFASCSDDAAIERHTPRAVSYVTLQHTEPGASSRLTGTVESWKREDIGFEVAGRILRVVEPGVDIEGRTFDENGALLSEGTVLAELDDRRYQIAAKQAQTAADAARTEIAEVIPALLEEAESALGLAEVELKRWTDLVAKGSAPQQKLDLAEAAHRAAKAKVAQVQAAEATKTSLLNTALATVEQANVNIADCEMTSPFTGQIARVHVIPGGYVLPGQPVVTVQMMDPMRIQIAVSPTVDKRINFNDRVRVYLPDSNESLEGYVYLKDTYADPATRTYLVTLLVRNRKIEEGVPEHLKGKTIAKTEKLWTLQPDNPADPSGYFIDVDAIHEDEDGYYVWKVENVTSEQLYEEFDPLLTVSKVRVSPGDQRLPALQVFTFRELADLGGLDPANDVIVGQLEGEITDSEVLLIRETWQLRPGDLAEVALRGDERSAGFYVPRVAILYDGKTHYLFAVRAGSDTAERVDVQPLETAGQRQRVEPLEEGKLQDGDRIIVGGTHYVMHGEQVSLAERLE